MTLSTHPLVVLASGLLDLLGNSRVEQRLGGRRHGLGRGVVSGRARRLRVVDKVGDGGRDGGRVTTVHNHGRGGGSRGRNGARDGRDSCKREEERIERNHVRMMQ